MSLESLPAIWQAALLDIAAIRSCPWKGILCLPGGARTVEQLVAFGAVEVLKGDPRYCTLTPWGAQTLLGVELFEWADDAEPTWTWIATVEAVGDTPVVTRGERGVRRLGALERMAGEDRPWYEESDGGDEVVPPAPVADDWGNVVTVAGQVLYREDDIKRMQRAAAKAKKAARRASKAAKARRAG